MRFSVIIPTYSRLRALRQCLAALRAQDFPAAGYEVIVVDDASPSPVSPLAPELETGLTLTLLHTPHNQGPAAARNLGAQHARGHWLAFTDDDCIPAPDWLSSLRRTLDSHPGCAVGGRSAGPKKPRSLWWVTFCPSSAPVFPTHGSEANLSTVAMRKQGSSR